MNLIFTVMGECRINRTQQEYAAIAAKLPALKILAHEVNSRLEWMHQRSFDSGIQLPLLCRFQAGDERYAYEEYPRKISQETIRKALEVCGMRTPRGKRAKPL